MQHQSDSQMETEPSPLSTSGECPDGGSKAWLTVFGTWCFNFTSFGWAASLGVFHAYFSTHQLSEYSQSTISWISSADLFVLLVFAPIAGRLFDSYGPHRLLLAGSLMHLAGLIFLSFSTQYYQIILSESILSGTGASTVYYASLNAVSTYFSKRKAFAIGFVGSGAALGGIAIPLMFDALIARGLGFAWALRSLTLVFLVLLVLGNLTCTSRLVHRARTPGIADFFRPLKETQYLLLTIGTFFTFWVLFVPNTYLPNYARAQGASDTLATSTLIILNGTSLVGRILSGWMADRFGRLNTISCSTASIIIALILWIPESRGSLMVFSAIYGFTSGAFISLVPPAVALISDINEIGVRTGMVYGISAFACLSGIPITGALLIPGDDNKLTYKWMQAFSIVAMGLGLCSFTAMRYWYYPTTTRI